MTSPSVESRIAECVGEYSADMAAAIVACRRMLRARFPRGYELVFDNYNALVFGFSPSDRTSDAFISLAAYPRWLTLFFLHGASLRDPAGLLTGSGRQVRGIRLKTPGDLDDERVQALMAQAISPLAGELASAPPLTTIVKMVAAKQRPRRLTEERLARAGAVRRPQARRKRATE